MIKGTRWLFIVLLLSVEEWIASSQFVSLYQGGQFQKRNNIFLQPLRNGHYLPPIPINFPPSFNNDRSESASQSSSADSSIRSPSSMESPWIPMQNGDSEEQVKKNVYVPPIRPPPMIVTRRPIKNTFNIPLTKSIQVSQGRPNIQTTGYIRKNLVKLHATRTTTENPRLKMIGQLAESTVQTLLNFTPVDESWKPKSISTSRPTAAPNFNFGRNLGSKVDKHLNYTGIRFGKLNSVMETMPKNGAGVKVIKNETNFVMRFTPEDIKYTAVEVKSENVDSPPFFIDRPEIKNFNEEFKNHRVYFDGLTEEQKSAADLRKESNVPYQGQKSSMKRPTAKNIGSNSNSGEHRTLFDVFPSIQKPNIDSKVTQYQGQKPFGNNPNSAGKIDYTSKVNDGVLQQNGDGPFSPQRIKNQQSTSKNFNKDHRTYFIESSNNHGVSSEQQLNTNRPYKGISTSGNKHSASKNPALDSTNPKNGHRTFFDTNPSKSTHTSENRDKQQSKENLYFADTSKTSTSNFSTPYGSDSSYLNSKESLTINIPPTGGAFNYNLPSNFNKNNRIREKDGLRVAKVPLSVGTEYGKTRNNPGKETYVVKINNIQQSQNSAEKNIQGSSSQNSSPKSPLAVSISHEDASNSYNNKNAQLNNNDQVSKPAFDQAPKLRLIKLKNPPKHLQFDNHNLAKPVISANSASGNKEKLGTFTFSAKDRSEELKNPNTDKSKETERTKLGENTNFYAPKVPVPKVEYYEKEEPVNNNKPEKGTTDSVYFQPAFPGTAQKTPQDNSQQKFENYNSGQTYVQSSQSSKENKPKTSVSDKVNFIPMIPYDTSREKQKNGQDGRTTKNIIYSLEDPRSNNGRVVVSEGSVNDFAAITDGTTRDTVYSPEDPIWSVLSGSSINNYSAIVDGTTKNTIYSAEDLRQNTGRVISGSSVDDFSGIITLPPVFTKKFDSQELDSTADRNRVNRTENYVIQRKPALLPEISGKPRKPKITISTGMLAGILIAALVFLGFLTGSMVYAFHQWKFGRSRTDRQKKKMKARNPGFPPEYLDENFAGNTYIHNNIFLPTPQNMDERNPSDPETTSVAGEEVAQEVQGPSTSSRPRRQHRTFRGDRDE